MKLSASDQSQLALLQGPVADELEDMHRGLEAALASDIPLVDAVGRHLLQVGGKRFRPTLLLHIAHLGSSDRAERVRAATSIELIHTATLVHDDVMDRCMIRRGRPTVNARWNDRVSLMMGDFLYSKAFAIMVDSGLPELRNILAVCTHHMSIGEMLQLEQRGRLDISEKEYSRMVSEKTATLFGAACRMGAVLGGAEPREVERWTTFGERLGMAFQIIDDVFDFVAQEREIGKPVGNDLREGHATLPLIGALERCPVAERTFVLDLIRKGEHLNGRWDEVVEFVKRHGGIQHARDRASSYAVAAREALGPVSASPHHRALALAVEHVVDRAR